MKFGLDIFEYDPLHYADLASVERENTLLLEIWNLKQEWDNDWEVWKDIRFYDLDCDQLDDICCYDYQEKLRNFDKEIKATPIFEYLSNKFDLFRKNMPLISDLRHESMRERHWKELRIEVKEEFNE